MYESTYGLKRRPFAATPDATCFLGTPALQAALDELTVAVEMGLGIGVATAPAGVGKTLLCEKLITELPETCQTIFLRHANFVTRRALLQTILCELGQPFAKVAEQELRLDLKPLFLQIRASGCQLALICDEAHLLSDQLLEELRTLADWADAGQPLVRVVLVGQPGLDEKLAQPQQAALAQRIRSQICLPLLTREESIDYVDYRLTWGGGRTTEIFTPDALECMARASDGIPRCLNQLADHSLLLGYVGEKRPIGADVVLEALADLRRLPLQWNESLSGAGRSERTVDAAAEFDVTSSATHVDRATSAVEFAAPSTTVLQSSGHMAAIEVGGSEPMAWMPPAASAVAESIPVDHAFESVVDDPAEAPSESIAPVETLTSEQSLEFESIEEYAGVDDLALTEIEPPLAAEAVDWQSELDDPYLARSTGADWTGNACPPDDATVPPYAPRDSLAGAAGDVPSLAQPLDVTPSFVEERTWLDASEATPIAIPSIQSSDWTPIDEAAAANDDEVMSPIERIDRILPLLHTANAVELVGGEEPVPDAIGQALSESILRRDDEQPGLEDELHYQVIEISLEAERALAPKTPVESLQSMYDRMSAANELIDESLAEDRLADDASDDAPSVDAPSIDASTSRAESVPASIEFTAHGKPAQSAAPATAGGRFSNLFSRLRRKQRDAAHPK